MHHSGEINSCAFQQRRIPPTPRSLDYCIESGSCVTALDTVWVFIQTQTDG